LHQKSNQKQPGCERSDEVLLAFCVFEI
jgi:hypothetical protein